MVDQNRIKGTANEIKGSIKDAVGKVTGNDKLRVEGKTDKAIGKTQNIVGKAKDALRGDRT